MPGRCPSCNQTYADESLTFCPNDGTPLNREASSSYDPPPGMYPGQQPPGNYPPPQPGYYPGAQQQGGQAPPPGWQPPYGQQQQYAPQYGAAAGGKNKLPIIIGVLALILIGGGIGLYFLLSKDSAPSTVDSSSTPNVTRSPGSTTSTFPTPSTTTTTTTGGGSYTEDEKHKLFQAVGITADNALIVEVAQKIGLLDSSGQPNPNFKTFTEEHMKWATRNMAFIREHLDKDKARAYVMANK